MLKEVGPDGKLRFKDTLFGLLRSNPEAYADNLERHFVKHLRPFVHDDRGHSRSWTASRTGRVPWRLDSEPVVTSSAAARAGFLPVEEVQAIAREGLARLPLDGRRVLVLIPDGTRTMPMPLLFDVLDEALGPRAAALDYLVALGTHAPMSDAQLSQLVGPAVVERPGRRARVFNHRWDDPASLRDARDDPGRARSSSSPAAS